MFLLGNSRVDGMRVRMKRKRETEDQAVFDQDGGSSQDQASFVNKPLIVQILEKPSDVAN